MSSALNAAGGYATSAQEAYLSAAEKADLPQPAEGSSLTINFGVATKNSLSGSASPAVIVSLSSEARNALSGEQVALQVMVGDAYSPPAALVATAHTSPTAVQPTVGNPAGTNASANETASSGAPLPSAAQIQSMSASDWLYATTNVQDFTAGLTSAQASSFEAAYNAKTLNIQKASDIPQLDYSASFTTSATATGTGGSSTVSMNSAWASQQYGPNCVVRSDPLYGGILVSWGAQSSVGSIPITTPSPPSVDGS
jgi:hypothetical protein